MLLLDVKDVFELVSSRTNMGNYWSVVAGLFPQRYSRHVQMVLVLARLNGGAKAVHLVH